MSLTFIENLKHLESSETLLKNWRQVRAFRVGTTIAKACFIFLIFIMPLDYFYSLKPVYLTDILFLAGCLLSLKFTKESKFCWLPLYLGFWINSIPSIYYSGGLLSPLLGLYIALYYVSAIVVQNKISNLVILTFTGLNFLGWILLQLISPVVVQTTMSSLFVGPTILVMIIAIVLCVYTLLVTESQLSQEIYNHYKELTHTKADLAKEELISSAKSSFIANVSHELRTPLGAILGFTEVLLNDKNNLKNEQIRNLETVYRNGHKLLKLVDDLLDISKIEAGKIDLEEIIFKPQEAVDEVIRLLKVNAEKKNIQLVHSVSTAVPELVKADSMRFQQILFNIVGNAIKFTDKGSVEVFMDFMPSAVKAAQGKLMLKVTDSGRGLTAQEQTKLFKPFSQVDASMTRKYGGTGLGLILARKLAEVMGGQMHLEESRLGTGSVFTFYILVQTLVKGTLNTSDYNNVKPQNLSLKGLNILVVDDSIDNQDLIKVYLKNAGAKTKTEDNGASAVDEALNEKYDAILMDVQMPILDGLQATEILRKKGFIKPIIAITAHAMKEDRERCLFAGCNAYLSKPLNQQNLIRTISNLVNTSK